MSKKPSEQTRDDSSLQTTRPERVKAMEASLKVAAQIRHDLLGRAHTDSTDLAAEDRQR
jgi:hypothetical protein